MNGDGKPDLVVRTGVFTAIAVAGSTRHHLRHGRAFPGEQKPVLIFEALQPAPRYVVLASRRLRSPGDEPLRFEQGRNQSVDENLGC